ncbi:MAG: TIGR02186 family protein [Deltaproteobacteria bacterium]|nr:TIGR02186 family protein [Deltaproteobacteria bacterium]
MSHRAITRRAPLAGLLLCGLLALATLAPAAPPAANEGKLVVEPPAVGINAFFSGINLTVTGDLPPGSQAVLTVRGKRIEEELMRKSRHWDLWMNSGEVDIDNAPLLYMASSSTPELLSPAAGEVPWGYAAIERNVKFSGNLKPVEDDAIFREFVELKERDKLYTLMPGGLAITQTSPGQWQARASFHLPSRLKHGTYHVSLWVLQDGKLVAKHSTTFQVELEGLPAFLHAMARNHGILYGLLAVAVAMGVGMLSGLVFRRKGGGH